jgi:hypothetical protein
MGTKYSSVSISGYNSSPPADDGTTSAANQVTWAKHKTKIGDPLKTGIEAINTALVAALNESTRSISASESAVAGDHLKTIEIASTVSTTITVTLADAATMAAGYIIRIKNSGTGQAVIARTTSGDTIDGVVKNLVLGSRQSVILSVNADENGYIVISRTPEILSVKDYGAAGDGSTDDSSVISKAISYVSTAGGGVVLVPRSTTFYAIASPILMKNNVMLALEEGAHIKNTDTSDDYFKSSVVLFGTYGSSSPGSGYNLASIFQEASYPVGNIAAGDRTATTSSATHAGNFSAGDLVHISSIDFTSTGYPKYQMMGKVVTSVSGTGVVTLDREIPDAMSSSATSNEIIYAATSGTFSSGETVTGGTSSATGVVAGVFLSDNTKYLALTSVSGTFSAAETLTGGTSSATGTVSSIRTTPVIRKLNTGSVVWSSVSGAPTAGCLINSGIVALGRAKIEQAKTSGSAYQAIHASCFECFIDGDLEIIGIDAIGGNPFAFSRIGEGVKAFYRRLGYELAYATMNSKAKGFLSRLGDYANSYQFAVQLPEDGGADNEIDVTVGSEFGTVSTQAAIGTGKLRTRIRADVNGGIGSAIAIIAGGDFSSVRGSVVKNPGTNGINCAADSCDIGGNVVVGVPSGSRGIRMTSASSYCSVHDNIIGDRSSPQTQDTILDDNGETTTNIYWNNRTKISQPRRCEPQATTYTTASESTLETYTIESNTAVTGMAWEVEWCGNATGTNGQKDVRIKVAGTTVATSTIATATTGAFYGKIIVATQSANSWVARGIQDTAGTLAAITGSNGITNAFTSSCDITLTAQLTSASDTIALRYFSVTPKGDQFV